MSEFKKREQAAEGEYVLNEQQEFRVSARRNKLLGQWAAAHLRKSDADADAYVKEVIRSDMEEPGSEDVFRKIKQDFISAGREVPDSELRERMGIFETEARKQIMGEEE